MFNSRHPIVCSPMNGVSDLTLAIACADAGIVPSFVPAVYTKFSDFLQALKEFKSNTDSDVVVALAASVVIDNRLILLYPTLGITHIEILDLDIDLTEENINKLNHIRTMGIKILLKCLRYSDLHDTHTFVDGVTIKSPDGAGRSYDNVNIVDEIQEIKRRYNNIEIIASGGIKSKEDIDTLLTAGATAVGIGTLFAMSKESSIPIEVKNKLLLSTSGDIRRLKAGAQQRAVVFEEKGNDDYNNTQGLNQGLQSGTAGHIFMGNAIDSVTEILTVKEIVDHLVS